MDLYFLLCGTFAILVSFGVIDKTLKVNNLNKLFLSLFLIVSCVLSVLNNFSVFGTNFSLNFVLYFLVCFVLFFSQKKPKEYISSILVCLMVIGIFLFYNAINLTNFEFDFVKPYFYFALVFGIMLFYICPSFKSVLCGTFFGSVLFEFLFYEFSLKFAFEPLVLGGQMTITFCFVTMLSYFVFYAFVHAIKMLKEKRFNKNLT